METISLHNWFNPWNDSFLGGSHDIELINSDSYFASGENPVPI